MGFGRLYQSDAWWALVVEEREFSFFVVDLLLGCRVGYVAEDLLRDEGLERVFYRRTGPIAAAIAVTIDAPGRQAGGLEQRRLRSEVRPVRVALFRTYLALARTW